MLLTYGALFWAVRQVFVDPALAKVLIAILVASGFVMALVMIGHKFSGEDKLLWIRKARVEIVSAGPFVNRNNYAAYINLVFPITLALGAHCHSRCPQYNPQATVSQSHPSYLIYFMAAVMVGSVFFSGSRAGMIICSGLAGAWIIKTVSALIRRGRQSQSLSLVRLLVPFGLIVLILAAVLASLGIEHIAAQTARIQTTLSELTIHNGRMDSYRGTLAMFFDHWLYGSGASAFSSLFPFYQPPSVEGWWLYAHSDWLQWLAELGVVGSMLVFFVLCSLCFFPAKNIRVDPCSSMANVIGSPADPRPSANNFQSSIFNFRFPLFLSLLGVCLHAFVDFPMHIPGIAITAVAFLALLSARMDVASCVSRDEHRFRNGPGILTQRHEDAKPAVLSVFA